MFLKPFRTLKTFYISHAVEDLTSHVTLVTSSLYCNYVISLSQMFGTVTKIKLENKLLCALSLAFHFRIKFHQTSKSPDALYSHVHIFALTKFIHVVKIHGSTVKFYSFGCDISRNNLHSIVSIVHILKGRLANFTSNPA